MRAPCSSWNKPRDLGGGTPQRPARQISARRLTVERRQVGQADYRLFAPAAGRLSWCAPSARRRFVMIGEAGEARGARCSLLQFSGQPHAKVPLGAAFRQRTGARQSRVAAGRGLTGPVGCTHSGLNCGGGGEQRLRLPRRAAPAARPTRLRRTLEKFMNLTSARGRTLAGRPAARL